MSKLLPDLTRAYPAQPRHILVQRDVSPLAMAEAGKPVGAKIQGRRMPSGRWNRLSFPERVVTTSPTVETRASGGKRQHQAHRNVQRLYRPQDQRGVTTVFVIMDRVTGQVLARVRGSALHCEHEAEQLARSQGCELADLKVIFEGELG